MSSVELEETQTSMDTLVEHPHEDTCVVQPMTLSANNNSNVSRNNSQSQIRYGGNEIVHSLSIPLPENDSPSSKHLDPKSQSYEEILEIEQKLAEIEQSLETDVLNIRTLGNTNNIKSMYQATKALSKITQQQSKLIHDYKKKLTGYKTQLEKYKLEVSSMKAMISDSASKLSKANSELREEKAESLELKGELIKLKMQVNELTSQNSEFKSQKAFLQKTTDRLNSQEMENVRLKNIIKELNSQNESLKLELSKTKDTFKLQEQLVSPGARHDKGQSVFLPLPTDHEEDDRRQESNDDSPCGSVRTSSPFDREVASNSSEECFSDRDHLGSLAATMEEDNEEKDTTRMLMNHISTSHRDSEVSHKDTMSVSKTETMHCENLESVMLSSGNQNKERTDAKETDDRLGKIEINEMASRQQQQHQCTETFIPAKEVLSKEERVLELQFPRNTEGENSEHLRKPFELAEMYTGETCTEKEKNSSPNSKIGMHRTVFMKNTLPRSRIIKS